jgi:hypothetical protein
VYFTAPRRETNGEVISAYKKSPAEATTMRGVVFGVCGGFLLLGASTGPAAWGLEPSKADPNAWKEETAAFAKLDADKLPMPGGIVFVGSSSIRLWDTGKSFTDPPVINRGFGGSQICDSTQFADELVVK